MRRATAKSFAAPDGENLDQVRRRVLDFFDSMCRSEEGLCVIWMEVCGAEREEGPV